MKKSTPLRRVEFGYFLLIALAVVQQLFIFWNIYVNQSFTFTEFLFSVGTLAALLIGFFLPVGVSTVAAFVYLVTYFVWLSTLAPVNALTLSWILFSARQYCRCHLHQTGSGAKPQVYPTSRAIKKNKSGY